MWLVQEWAVTIHSSESINMPLQIMLDKHITDYLYEIKITIYNNSI